MNGSALFTESEVLSSLRRLSWTVTRLHPSARGTWIVTALKSNRIASVEIPEANAGEAWSAWIERLEQLLAASAYDPAVSAPPLLVCAMARGLAEIVPRLSQPEPAERGPEPSAPTRRGGAP